LARTTISIAFDDLAAVRLHERLPLAQLQPNDHVHGRLIIQIGDKVVPRLGYWAPNDVCLARWLGELDAVRASFTRHLSAHHEFDEGEEGQPSFVFEREGARAFLTIADSELSGGVGDPEWQRVEFLAADFVSEVDRVRSEFAQRLKASSTEAEQWINLHLLNP